MRGRTHCQNGLSIRTALAEFVELKEPCLGSGSLSVVRRSSNALKPWRPDLSRTVVGGVTGVKDRLFTTHGFGLGNAALW